MPSCCSAPVSSNVRRHERNLHLSTTEQLNSDRQIEHSAVIAGAATLTHTLLDALVVDSVKPFYDRTTFSQTESADHMTFQSFEADVLWRHKNEFDACLLYLRDFVKVIDTGDVQCIQDFEVSQAEAVKCLRNNISALNFESLKDKLIRMDRAIFKLSNHRLYIEIGADPEFKGIDWETQKGNEYVLFEGAVSAIRLLAPSRSDA